MPLHNSYSRATLLASLGAVLGSKALAQAMPTGMTETHSQRLGSVMWEKWMSERGIAATPQSVRVERYLQRVCDKLAPHVPQRLASSALESWRS